MQRLARTLSLTMTILIVTLVAASPASAGPGYAQADITDLGNNTLRFHGLAWDLYPSWTYSFRLRQGPPDSWPREWIWEGRKGNTYFSTPTYTYTRWGYGLNCVELRVYHSSTVGSNLVATSSPACT